MNYDTARRPARNPLALLVHAQRVCRVHNHVTEHLESLLGLYRWAMFLKLDRAS